jgi:hypothetical protein
MLSRPLSDLNRQGFLPEREKQRLSQGIAVP